nr:pectate lyase [uncultured Carboxylicivirga sp.]
MKNIFIISFLFLVAICAVSFSSKKEQRALAFPGAEGAGKYTTGGRGGFVYTVTNLNDEGPGSLRKGIRKHGTRTIVFAVSGYIDLKSQLVINNGDITIAGQTAPGKGICLRGQGLRINADNVVLRYLRVRPGDVEHTELDALTGIGHKDIIVDHCSFSWATDEVCSLYDNENLTLQWCLISESLNNSYHHKGAHGYGGIWGGMKATFHHNLLAHHKSRNPRLQGSRRHKQPDKEMVELINNVVYNWKSKCIYAGEEGNYSIIGNYFKPGPATGDKSSKQILEPYAPYANYNFYKNCIDQDKALTKDNLAGIKMPVDSVQKYFTSKRLYNSGIEIQKAEKSYENVLANVGANLYRDTIDQQIIEDVKKGTARGKMAGIINSQEEVGGWPTIEIEAGPEDNDGDGMPDEWEIQNGLNPNDSQDGPYYSLNKNYTNLEVYLCSLIK